MRYGTAVLEVDCPITTIYFYSAIGGSTILATASFKEHVFYDFNERHKQYVGGQRTTKIIMARGVKHANSSPKEESGSYLVDTGSLSQRGELCC